MTLLMVLLVSLAAGCTTQRYQEASLELAHVSDGIEAAHQAGYISDRQNVAAYKLEVLANRALDAALQDVREGGPAFDRNMAQAERLISALKKIERDASAKAEVQASIEAKREPPPAAPLPAATPTPPATIETPREEPPPPPPPSEPSP
jgi:hypothetical protein